MELSLCTWVNQVNNELNLQNALAVIAVAIVTNDDALVDFYADIVRVDILAFLVLRAFTYSSDGEFDRLSSECLDVFGLETQLLRFFIKERLGQFS